MAEDTSKLSGLLASLPQELYDHIYDLTFTADDDFVNLGTIVKQFEPQAVTGGHKLLAISQDSRRKFAASYYRNVIFVGYDMPTCIKWLESLPRDHLGLLQDIRCIIWRRDMSQDTIGAKALANCRSKMAQEMPKSAPIVDNIRFGMQRKMTEDLMGFTSVGSAV